MKRSQISVLNNLNKKIKSLIPWIRVKILRSLIVTLRFVAHRPKHTIAVRSQYIGGVGGAERLLRALVESMPDCEFHVFCENFIKRGFLPKTWNYRVNPHIDPGKTYDIYFYVKIASPPDPLGIAWRRSVICPAGNDISADEKRFDAIVLEGENGRQYCSHKEKCRRVIPDFTVGLPRRTRPVGNLPQRYFLTVFNPYGEVKGHDIMFRVAPESRLPIVWSFSTGTFPADKYGAMPEVGNLIKKCDLSQRQLYYLYEHAAGYVSFSRSEGLGWSIADAFMYDLPIISRNTGFVTFVNEQRGLHLYDNEKTLKELLDGGELERPQYDKSILDKYSYERLFESLLGED